MAAIPVGQHDAGNTLHAEIAHQLQSEKLNGAVWALVTPNAGILTGAAGVKHAGTGQAMTPTNRVHVGSVAKTVLAIGVLRLVTIGKLTLDTEVATLLPTLQLNNPWAATDPIRVRHLLEHTAGVENFRFYQMFTLRARADTPLSAALGESPLHISSRPGTTSLTRPYRSMRGHLSSSRRLPPTWDAWRNS